MIPVRASKLWPSRSPVLLAAALVVLQAAPLERARADAVDTCRKAITARSVHFVADVLRARRQCLAAVATGDIPPASNCLALLADIPDPRTRRRVDTALARLQRKLSSRCGDLDLSTFGFPGRECAGLGPPFDSAALEACTETVVEAQSATIARGNFPTPARTLARAELGCAQKMGKRGERMVARELVSRQKCLSAGGSSAASVDCRAALSPYGPGTGDPATDQMIARAYRRFLRGSSSACTVAGVAVAFDDGDCDDAAGDGFDALDLVDCTFQAHRLAGEVLLALSFPAPVNCGDGVAEGDEQCDDGNEDNEDACTNDCESARCGDGFVFAGVEECDDGNQSSTDACTNDCQSARCGDGFVFSGVEECDDQNTVETDACRNDCSAAVCGDGLVCAALDCTTGPHGGPEECDDGATIPGDGCSQECGVEFCGDGIVNTMGEECDDGALNGNGANQCRLDCTLPFCGDGVVDDGAPYNETCDPPNATTCCSTCVCDNECPGVHETEWFAGVGATCASNADCGPGTCTDGLCRTETRLDIGFSGLAHGADTGDRRVLRTFLDCGDSAPCGQCEIAGIDPAYGHCRCAGDGNNGVLCDEPFRIDVNDCSGQLCNCYLGPPQSLSAGNVPSCVLERLREDIEGTVDVDSGAISQRLALALDVHVASSLVKPCPVCVGDATPNDGVRDGTCDGGVNDGAACDAQAFDSTFPAYPPPQGGYHSLDCFPNPGQNASGSGLRIDLVQSTGESVLGPPAVPCGHPFAPFLCQCGSCVDDRRVTCTSNQDCADGGVGGECDVRGRSSPLVFPYNTRCGEQGCSDTGDGVFGICYGAPPTRYCDGIVRSNGNGFLTCVSDSDCTASGLPGGACTLSTPLSCFLDEIIARGRPDPLAPVTAATFCLPRLNSASKNNAIGLEGQGRLVAQLQSRTICVADPTREYVAGFGGCVD